MSTAAPTPTARPRPSSGRVRRLMIYLTGVAIGLVLLGYFRARSNLEAAERERNAPTQHPGPRSPEAPAQPNTSAIPPASVPTTTGP